MCVEVKKPAFGHATAVVLSSCAIYIYSYNYSIAWTEQLYSCTLLNLDFRFCSSYMQTATFAAPPVRALSSPSSTTVRAILLRIAVSQFSADLARGARPPSINRRRVGNAKTTLNKNRQLREKRRRTMPSSSDTRNRKHEHASAKTKIV